MNIILVHKHYDKAHLEEVKSIMLKKGTPKIRAMWSAEYESWLAVEGCHRLRAAEQLGLTPIIIDITNNKTVSYQYDDETIISKITDLALELNNNAWKSHVITFEEK
jgi:hypothetical protein